MTPETVAVVDVLAPLLLVIALGVSLAALVLLADAIERYERDAREIYDLIAHTIDHHIIRRPR